MRDYLKGVIFECVPRIKDTAVDLTARYDGHIIGVKDNNRDVGSSGACQVPDLTLTRRNGTIHE